MKYNGHKVKYFIALKMVLYWLTLAWEYIEFMQAG